MLKDIDDELRQGPEVLSLADIPAEHVARTMKLEQLHLRFGNGVERNYQRMMRGKRGAVMMIPLLDADTVLLIREYAAGTEQYELLLPKGRIDEGEEILEAANREMMEEVGMGARQLSQINTLTLAPTFMGHETHVVVAHDLYEQRLEGDEPEELEVIPWKLSALHELVTRGDCTEGRSIAALFQVRDMIQRGELAI